MGTSTYRDVKTANVLRCAGEIVKLSDLGVAKLMKGAMTKTQIGTPHYMPPEVCLKAASGGGARACVSVARLVVKDANCACPINPTNFDLIILSCRKFYSARFHFAFDSTSLKATRREAVSTMKTPERIHITGSLSGKIESAFVYTSNDGMQMMRSIQTMSLLTLVEVTGYAQTATVVFLCKLFLRTCM